MARCRTPGTGGSRELLQRDLPAGLIVGQEQKASSGTPSTRDSREKCKGDQACAWTGEKLMILVLIQERVGRTTRRLLWYPLVVYKEDQDPQRGGSIAFHPERARQSQDQISILSLSRRSREHTIVTRIRIHPPYIQTCRSRVLRFTAARTWVNCLCVLLSASPIRSPRSSLCPSPNL